MSADTADRPTLAAEVSAALAERLTALADDELVLGHRNAEWTGHAPLLEEDIAIANVAQDEIGHAVLWYGLLQDLTGQDPDRLAFFRHADGFRTSVLVERPRGDWAFTMLRQFLFDSYEAELLARLTASSWAPLAETTAKIANEEIFHLRHSRTWFERLALGTEESRRRLEDACALALPELHGLLAAHPGEELLSEAGYAPPSEELASALWQRLQGDFAAVELDLSRWLPAGPVAAAGSPGLPGDVERKDVDEHLVELVSTMQSVARADPEAQSW